MDISTATEQELKDMDVIWPHSADELIEYIETLVKRKHDYGTCVYAMSMAAVAAYHYVAHKMGATGFQASCADLDIIKRTRLIKGPFAIIKGEDMLYPQNDIYSKVAEWVEGWKDWAGKEASKKIHKAGGELVFKIYTDDNGEKFTMPNIHPDVWNHWQELKRREILFRKFDMAT